MCMNVYGLNGVHGSLWECMGEYMSAHESISVHMSLCECNEFLWLLWGYVNVCDFYDCIWAYVSVCDFMWVNVRVMIVFECIWKYVNDMSVFGYMRV